MPVPLDRQWVGVGQQTLVPYKPLFKLQLKPLFKLLLQAVYAHASLFLAAGRPCCSWKASANRQKPFATRPKRRAPLLKRPLGTGLARDGC